MLLLCSFLAFWKGLHINIDGLATTLPSTLQQSNNWQGLSVKTFVCFSDSTRFLEKSCMRLSRLHLKEWVQIETLQRNQVEIVGKASAWQTPPSLNLSADGGFVVIVCRNVTQVSPVKPILDVSRSMAWFRAQQNTFRYLR